MALDYTNTISQVTFSNFPNSHTITFTVTLFMVPHKNVNALCVWVFVDAMELTMPPLNSVYRRRLLVFIYYSYSIKQ